MSEQYILLHLGYPKTATTWLQKRVFDNHSLGFRSPFGIRSASALETFLLHPMFGFSAVEARSVFMPAIQGAWRDRLVPVISEETLLGNIVSGQYWGESIVHNIRETFAGERVRVLLTIREQRSLIFSAYKEHVLTGGYHDIESYLWDGRGRPGFRGLLHLDALKYDVIFEGLARVFGADNVMVLSQEEVAVDPALAISRLQDFVGVSSNEATDVETERAHVGLRGATLKLKSWLNRHVPLRHLRTNRDPLSRRMLDRLCRLVDRHMPAAVHSHLESEYRKQIDSIVGAYFDASNRRLHEICRHVDYPAERGRTMHPSVRVT